jgi:portal protein
MVASEDMKAVTGIYDASLGARSNETSGIAIRNRTAQGDTATYVFIDNMEAAITTTGHILVDLIPHYYSDERVIRIIGEDGEIEKFQAINKLMPDGAKWNDISRGKFDVVVTTGPAYATRRLEAREGMLEYARIDPVFVNLARDQIIRSMDFPGGDKMAERAALTLPPGMDPDADKKRMEMQQQMQQAQGQPQPSPEQQQAMMEQQGQMLKLQREREASQAKIEMSQQESLAAMQLEREKFEFQKQIQWQELELQRELALEKLGIDRLVASHDAILDTATAAHAAVLDTAQAQHAADMSEQNTAQAAE